MIAVLRATGMRLSELAGIRYNPDDPRRSDLDLWHREITVHGKGGKTRTVKISYDAARVLDRYLRVRARHGQAYRPQLWPGISNRDPMTASAAPRKSLTGSAAGLGGGYAAIGRPLAGAGRVAAKSPCPAWRARWRAWSARAS